MPHKAFLLLHITIFLLFFNTNIYAEALKIIPLKKPALESKVIKKKIVQGILKPKPKPKKKPILDKPTVNGYNSAKDWKQETIDMYGCWPYDEDYHD